MVRTRDAYCPPAVSTVTTGAQSAGSRTVTVVWSTFPMESVTLTTALPGEVGTSYTPPELMSPTPDTRVKVYPGTPPEAVKVSVPPASTVAGSGEMASGS